MLARIIVGLIGIPIVILLVFWPGGLPFQILIGVAVLMGMLEFYRAARKGGIRPQRLLGVIAGVLSVYIACISRASGLDIVNLALLLPVLVGLTMLSLIYELFRSQRLPYVNVGATVLGVVYVSWFLMHFILLRSAGGRIQVGRWTADQGAWLVLFVLLCTWALDTGAYFIGKFYGRKKLAPAISPGKTIEGSVAGFISALVVGAVLGAVMKMPQPHGLVLGALVGIVGQLGDLAGSALKREVGIKDFSSLIPGHGGVLDRVDSLLFTAPVVFYYVSTFLQQWLGY